MITASDNYFIPGAPDIILKKPNVVTWVTMRDDDYHVAQLRLIEFGGTALLWQTEKTFTTAELTAFTASGANDVEKYYNLVEQAVADWLGDANPTVTFTIT